MSERPAIQITEVDGRVASCCRSRTAKIIVWIIVKVDQLEDSSFQGANYGVEYSSSETHKLRSWAKENPWNPAYQDILPVWKISRDLTTALGATLSP